MIKKFIYVTINNVNPLYLIISKINDYIKESNGNKNLMLDSLDESKDILKKKNEELSIIIRDLIRSITNTSNNFDEKYKKHENTKIL